MEIRLDNRYNPVLVVEADDVKIEQDIETRTYQKNTLGEVDFRISPKRDVDSKAIDQLVAVLYDIIYYYRNEPYDSSDLIKVMFDKLPPDIASRLSDELHNDYYND